MKEVCCYLKRPAILACLKKMQSFTIILDIFAGNNYCKSDICICSLISHLPKCFMSSLKNNPGNQNSLFSVV